MRKHFLFLFLTLIVSGTFQAQTKGTKVGYIDMEYILQNVPNYTEAQNQLEQKAQKWKQEVEAKKIEINKLKEALKAEKALLTKGLIEERITEITYLETEILEYQQKRFGPNGDLMKQKADLTKPIQDQVFTAIQDIAEAKKYDFIFDKTSDLTIIFAAKRFDISDQVIRVLNRAEKREQLTKKQLKAEEAKEAKEDAIDESPALQDRQKALEAKKASRDKILADRLLLQEQRKKETEDKRAQFLADREAKKNGTVSANTSTTGKTVSSPTEKAKDATTSSTVETKATQASTAKATSTDGAKVTQADDASKISAEEIKQKQADARNKAIEDRKKVIEDRKKALEEKRKKILEEREATKQKTDSINKTKTIN